MAKKSNKYWKERFELLEDSMNDKGEQYMKDTESLYHNAIKETEKEISRWYTRYANNEGITYQQAMQILSGKELKEFHMDVKEYIEKGKTLGVSKKWTKELERASINVHITRLEALKLQMKQQVEELTAKKSKGINKLMIDIYSDTFYKSAYKIQKGFGVASNFVKLDKKQIEKILSKPWTADGSNFSQRIWGSHRGQLVNKLHEGLTLNLIQGKSPDNLIKDISATFNVDRKRAATLVYTEKAYFQSIAQRDSFKNLGVEEYEIVATLDSLTSKICQTMDGKHFKLDDFQIGSNAPPFHPRCRTAIAPYFDDEFEDEVKRAARDEDGKYYTVPAKMKYGDWYKAFVDGDESVLEKLNKVVFNPYSLIERKNYSFYQKTKYDGKYIKRDSIIFKNDEGVEFVYPKGYDEEKQIINPRMSLSVFEKLNPMLRKNVKLVEFMDVFNPDDAFWGERYGIKDFISFANGGNGKITFWQNGDISKKRIESILFRTYNHETAHILDYKGVISKSNEWLSMVEKDKSIPTDYAKVSIREDFAESIAEYAINKEAFKKKCPNRYKFIKELFNSGK
ncbi:MAG: minor capsid protein [Coprobacillus sp.]|nr:minor capsid protein [Coprobacillus sp.]